MAVSVRQRFFILPISMLAVSFLISAAGCGGGGSGSDSDWLKIDEPTTKNSFQTDQPTVAFHGTSFPPSGPRPAYLPPLQCGGSVTTTYSVTWSNVGDTKTTSGTALANLGCSNGTRYVDWTANLITLELGTNVITVTASDVSEATAEKVVTVTRVPDVTPPTVVSFSPTGPGPVFSQAVIEVTFSEPPEQDTVNDQTFTVTDAATNLPVSGELTRNRPYLFQDSTEYFFHPSQPLTVGRTYEVRIDGVTDRAGHPMTDPFVFSFAVTDP